MSKQSGNQTANKRQQVAIGWHSMWQSSSNQVAIKWQSGGNQVAINVCA